MLSGNSKSKRIEGHSEPMHSEVFLSFATRHKTLVDQLRDQAERRSSMFRFRDYAIRPPSDAAWKREVEQIIRRAKITLCLLGSTTCLSDPVNWEIRKSVEVGTNVVAVYLQSDTTRIPAALKEVGIMPIPWDIGMIVSEMHARRF